MTKYVPTERSNTGKRVYHTDSDCHKLSRSEIREATQSEIEYHNLRECKACQGLGPDGGDGSDWKEFTSNLRNSETELVTVRVPFTHTEVYHSKDCHVVDRVQKKREITKAQAQEWDLRECKACTDQHGGSKNQKTNAYRLAADNDSIKELEEAINASD